MEIRDSRRIVGQIVQRLKRDRRGFGERPCSFYAQQGSEPFLAYILELKPVQHLLPYEQTGSAGDILTQEQQEQLKELVDRVDRYGELVSAWRQGRSASQNSLADLEQRLKFWAFRNLPDYCWGHVNLVQIVHALKAGLKGNVAGYSYEQDLLVWALPCLVGTLWAQVGEAARQVRAGLDPVRLRQQLRPTAERILSKVCETYGIYGIDADGVAERALHQVMCASDQEWTDHRHDVPQWALDKLEGQIKMLIPLYAEPNVGPEWYRNPSEERWELQKRRQFLQAFCDIV